VGAFGCIPLKGRIAGIEDKRKPGRAGLEDGHLMFGWDRGIPTTRRLPSVTASN